MIPTRALVISLVLPALPAIAIAATPWALPAWVALNLVIVVIAAGDAWLGRRGALAVARTFHANQVAGRRFDVGLRVTNTGDRSLSLRLAEDAPGEAEALTGRIELEQGQSADLAYAMSVGARGEHRFGPVTARWLSPLGLWERQLRVVTDDVVHVVPDFRALREGLPGRAADARAPVRARRRPGAESEFERLRPYVQGDPYRHVDWRATARRGELVSREFGQEVNQNVVFLIDGGRWMSARGAGGVTAFDQALDAAIAMGAAALRHGDRVGLCVFDREVRVWLPPRGGRRSAARLLRGTYDVFPRDHEPDFAVAFRQLSRRVKRRSLVVLLTSLHDEPSAELTRGLVRGLAGRHLPIAVWLQDPDVAALLDEEGADAPFVRAAAAEHLTWRRDRLRAMAREGALIVDAAPGDVRGELLSRYLEVKARRLL